MNRWGTKGRAGGHGEGTHVHVGVVLGVHHDRDGGALGTEVLPGGDPAVLVLDVLVLDVLVLGGTVGVGLLGGEDDGGAGAVRVEAGVVEEGLRGGLEGQQDGLAIAALEDGGRGGGLEGDRRWRELEEGMRVGGGAVEGGRRGGGKGGELGEHCEWAIQSTKQRECGICCSVGLKMAMQAVNLGGAQMRVSNQKNALFVAKTLRTCRKFTQHDSSLQN